MTKFWRWLSVVVIFTAILGPIIPQIVWSFAFRWYFPDLLPSVWSLDSWQYVFSESSRVMEGLINSVMIALTVSLLAVLVGLPAGRAIGLYSFRGKGLIEWLLMVPIIVPGIVAVMGIHIGVSLNRGPRRKRKLRLRKSWQWKSPG